MDSLINPYNPGAGTPPPELAGRDDILQKAENIILRTINNSFSRSLIILGLRGVGKTVLLNRIEQLAGEAKSYSERLFEYPYVDRLNKSDAISALEKPALKEGVFFNKNALDIIIDKTKGYPFFIQVWGSHVWDVSKSSPINENDAISATINATKALDDGFFKIRYERLTKRQQEYANAIAHLGIGPHRSTTVSNSLGITVKQAAPIRDEIIKKGIAYSPSRGLIAFTVPLFNEYILRIKNKS